jgi:ketosteroid isomerase-like protein
MPSLSSLAREKTMKKSYWSMALAGAILLCVTGVSKIPALAKEAAIRNTDKENISNVLTAQQAAWNRGDVGTFLEGYWHSPELTFSGSNGITRGWEGVLERYKRNYPDRAVMGQLDFSDLEFRFLGADAALVLGRWHLKREKDELGGVFSLVWQRFPEGWRIIHDHTSQTPSNSAH